MNSAQRDRALPGTLSLFDDRARKVRRVSTFTKEFDAPAYRTKSAGRRSCLPASREWDPGQPRGRKPTGIKCNSREEDRLSHEALDFVYLSITCCDCHVYLTHRVALRLCQYYTQHACQSSHRTNTPCGGDVATRDFRRPVGALAVSPLLRRTHAMSPFRTGVFRFGTPYR